MILSATEGVKESLIRRLAKYILVSGVTEARYRRILEVLHRRQPDLTLLAEDIHKPHNLSATLRSCDAVGIGTIHAINPTGGVPTFTATSASADKWVEVRVHRDLKEALDAAGHPEAQILAAHLSDEAIDYREVDYTGRTCIIFGNEKSGVSPEAASAADHHIVIPMLGMVRSLNVSVAAAVILFEAQRQRWGAGLYDRPQLEESAIAEQAFAWLHQTEAQRLQSPVSPLNKRGDG